MRVVVTYTTAPADYDYPYTKTVGVLAGRTKPLGSGSTSKIVRKVETLETHVEYQRDRYASGGIYMTVDEAEWAKRETYGLVEGF